MHYIIPLLDLIHAGSRPWSYELAHPNLDHYELNLLFDNQSHDQLQKKDFPSPQILLQVTKFNNFFRIFLYLAEKPL
jgi:hypothetical protein